MVSRPYTYWLSLGANIGDREHQLQRALTALARVPETAIQAISDVYETDPVGFLEQPPFLNLAVAISSALAPHPLLAAIAILERDLGRQRVVRFGPRTIDIDILLCGELIVDDQPTLIIPHPRMHERAFVLVPLAQIAPQAIHPVLGITVKELCDHVAGKEGVRWHLKYSPNDFGPIGN